MIPRTFRRAPVRTRVPLYAKLHHEFPHQIQKILIRDVSPDSRDKAARALKNVPSKSWTLFQSSPFATPQAITVIIRLHEPPPRHIPPPPPPHLLHRPPRTSRRITRPK